MNCPMKFGVCFPPLPIFPIFDFCLFIYLSLTQEGFWMIYRRPDLSQASFDHPCSKTRLRLDYACGPRQVSTTVEKCSLVPSLLMCRLHVWAVWGPASRLWLHNYIRATAPWEALVCSVSKWDAFWVAPPRRHADFSPRSFRLWKPVPTHFLVQCFVAQSQAVSLCLPTCSGKLRSGLADTFWSDCSGAATRSFLARKVSLNQVGGNVRSCWW